MNDALDQAEARLEAAIEEVRLGNEGVRRARIDYDSARHSLTLAYIELLAARRERGRLLDN